MWADKKWYWVFCLRDRWRCGWILWKLFSAIWSDLNPNFDKKLQLKMFSQGKKINDWVPFFLIFMRSQRWFCVNFGWLFSSFRLISMFVVRRGSSTVEQWTHKPLVLGSNPSLAIFYLTLQTIGSGIPARWAPMTSQKALANPSLAIFVLRPSCPSAFKIRDLAVKTLTRPGDRRDHGPPGLHDAFAITYQLLIKLFYLV